MWPCNKEYRNTVLRKQKQDMDSELVGRGLEYTLEKK